MRRLIAILVLLGGGSTAGLPCPMAQAEGSAAPASAAPERAEMNGHAAHHPAGPAGQPAPARSLDDDAAAPAGPLADPATHHGGAACSLDLMCGPVGLPSPSDPVITTGLNTTAPTSRAPGTGSVTFPSHDPPPPRLPV